MDALAGDGDIIIRGGPDAFHGFEFRLSAPGAPPADLQPGAGRAPALERIGDLARHTLLEVASMPRLWRDWLAKAGHGALKPAATLTLDHFHLSIQPAVDGLGVAMDPATLIEDDFRAGRLLTPFPAVSLPARSYFAYLPSAAPLPRRQPAALRLDRGVGAGFPGGWVKVGAGDRESSPAQFISDRCKLQAIGPTERGADVHTNQPFSYNVNMTDEDVPAELAAAFMSGDRGQDTERLRRAADTARRKMEALATEIRTLVASQPPLKLLSYLICHFHLAFTGQSSSDNQGLRPNKEVIKKISACVRVRARSLELPRAARG